MVHCILYYSLWSCFSFFVILLWPVLFACYVLWHGCRVANKAACVIFHNSFCVFLTGTHERPWRIVVQAVVRPQTLPLSSKGREHNKIIDLGHEELSRGGEKHKYLPWIDWQV